MGLCLQQSGDIFVDNVAQSSLTDLWEIVVEAVRVQLGSEAQADLLRTVSGIREEEDGLTVIVAEPIQRDWLIDHYLDFLARELRARSELPVRLWVRVDQATPRGKSRARRTPVEAAADPSFSAAAPPRVPPARRVGLSPRYTFDSFVVGTSNQMAASAAMTIGEQPGSIYNPLYVYGGVGLGKTHLIHAIGHTILKARPAARVVYRSTESFINEFIGAIQDRSMNAFRQRYRHECDALLIDDIQFLAGKEGTQDEFFHTFEALKNSGIQICITSDCRASELKLADRLRNRFEWGLTVDVQPPSLETRMAIIAKKAALSGIEIPDEVQAYLAETFRGNIRLMEGCLNRLGAFAGFARRPITTEFAREILRDQLPDRRQPTADDVMSAVADYYKLRLSELKGRRRHRSVARPRQIAMYLCRHTLGKSFPEIGREFGKDHSTVISACRKIDELMEEDPIIRTAVDVLQRQFQET